MSDTRKPWAHPGRESRHRRGYGREHVRLRAILLRQEPLCRLCQQKNPPRVTAATIADHVVPIAKGGAIHDLSNMQPVCAACHDEKTRADNGWRKPKPVTGLDGWPVE
jgi:5-methylcytosine-specific restriction protein A